MAEVLAPEGTRRRLTERQAELVEALVAAAAEEVEEHGYGGLSVRNVARRAGVAPATAYTYFSSKDHLLAELLWRRIQAVPEGAPDLSVPVADRLAEVVSALGTVATGSPAVAAACTPALLGDSPDVKALRDRIGAEVRRRLRTALAGEVDAGVVRVLVTTYFGALLTAGMGHMGYDRVPEFVADAARLMVDGAGEGRGRGPRAGAR